MSSNLIIRCIRVDLGEASIGVTPAILSSSPQPGAEHGHEPAANVDGASEDQEPLTKATKIYNLAHKQKVVHRSGLKHRRWLEMRKGEAMEGKG